LASAEGRAGLYVCIAGSGAPIRLLVNLLHRNVTPCSQLMTRPLQAGLTNSGLQPVLASARTGPPGMWSSGVAARLFIPTRLSKRTKGAHSRAGAKGPAGARLRRARGRLDCCQSHFSKCWHQGTQFRPAPAAAHLHRHAL